MWKVKIMWDFLNSNFKGTKWTKRFKNVRKVLKDSVRWNIVTERHLRARTLKSYMRFVLSAGVAQEARGF